MIRLFMTIPPQTLVSLVSFSSVPQLTSFFSPEIQFYVWFMGKLGGELYKEPAGRCGDLGRRADGSGALAGDNRGQRRQKGAKKPPVPAAEIMIETTNPHPSNADGGYF